jgi:hypothetical protein
MSCDFRWRRVTLRGMRSTKTMMAITALVAFVALAACGNTTKPSGATPAPASRVGTPFANGHFTVTINRVEVATTIPVTSVALLLAVMYRTFVVVIVHVVSAVPSSLSSVLPFASSFRSRPRSCRPCPFVALAPAAPLSQGRGLL